MQRSTHAKRLITAAVGLPLAAAAVFLGGIALFLLLWAVCALGLSELSAILRPGESRAGLRVKETFWAGLVLVGFALYGPGGGLGGLLVVFWLEGLFFLALPGRGQGGSTPDWSGLAGLAYLPCALGFFLTFPPVETFFTLTAVIVADTGAYYSGSLIGGPRIWPSVSPKKTWAGSLGGLGATMLWSLGYGLAFGAGDVAAWSWLGLGAAVNVAAQLGDFFESAVKRAAGVKDSGCILPGHGGVLDRVDGLIPAVPVYAALRCAQAYFG